eukprot:TRINITY_DN343_c0_g2_i3.p1 TRINITY_DN343_c0_g2~~TRINITY_DN343_c0_g2_i3.p1  ORF type:complete len:336 (+),score=24.87 TRINITY_DN343_c0_g2_i3:326-1333(+)
MASSSSSGAASSKGCGDCDKDCGQFVFRGSTKCEFCKHPEANHHPCALTQESPLLAKILEHGRCPDCGLGAGRHRVDRSSSGVGIEGSQGAAAAAAAAVPLDRPVDDILDVLRRQGEALQAVQRQGEHQGEALQRQGEALQAVQRQGEHQGEALQRQGEALQAVQRQGEHQGEALQRQGEALQRLLRAQLPPRPPSSSSHAHSAPSGLHSPSGPPREAVAGSAMAVARSRSRSSSRERHSRFVWRNPPARFRSHVRHCLLDQNVERARCSWVVVVPFQIYVVLDVWGADFDPSRVDVGALSQEDLPVRLPGPADPAERLEFPPRGDGFRSVTPDA